MKAIALKSGSTHANHDYFIEIDRPIPEPGANDLLVCVKAVGLNPIDIKVRKKQGATSGENIILGWDACGIVEKVGANVSHFKKGDHVYYSGEYSRDGCNAQYQLVDQRLVAYKPESLEFEQSAALPLTSITAWESLFERLSIPIAVQDDSKHKSILIIGGGGGVGSIATQLVAQLTTLNIICSVSNSEAEIWVKKMGADFVVYHNHPLVKQVEKFGFSGVDYILCLFDPGEHWQTMSDLINPQGKICLLVDSSQQLDLNRLKRKSVTVTWEFMFTRSMYRTEDMEKQGQILSQITKLIDSNVLYSTQAQSLGVLTPESLSQGHRLIETQHTIGKLTFCIDS